MTHVQVIRDIRDRGYVCVCGEETTQPCIAALNAIVFLFDSMPTAARIGNDAKAAGRELIVVVDEAHEIVQARKYKVLLSVQSDIHSLSLCNTQVAANHESSVGVRLPTGANLLCMAASECHVEVHCHCNMRACNFVPGHLQDS